MSIDGNLLMLQMVVHVRSYFQGYQMYRHNNNTNKLVFRSFVIHILAWSLATPD